MPKLVVQMGHVARRTGATGTTGEQDYARRAAAAIVAEIAARSSAWTVVVIYADPTSRSAYAGDAFVAVHCDGSVSPTARGASVGYRTPEGAAFGDAIMDAYEAHGWDGGFRDDNYTPALKGFYGTRYAVERGNRRAVIVEAGFLTNPGNRALLTGPDGATRLARAVADALRIPARITRPASLMERLMADSDIDALVTRIANATADAVAARKVPGFEQPQEVVLRDTLRVVQSGAHKDDRAAAQLAKVIAHQEALLEAFRTAQESGIDADGIAKVEAAAERATTRALEAYGDLIEVTVQPVQTRAGTTGGE